MFILCVRMTFLFYGTDQQADWVLPAAGPPREAGERQEEDGPEATVHAPRLLGTTVSSAF